MECANFYKGNCKEKMKGEILKRQVHYVDGYGTIYPSTLSNFGYKINPRVFWCQHCRNKESTFDPKNAPTTQDIMRMILHFNDTLNDFMYRDGREAHVYDFTINRVVSSRCALREITHGSEASKWRQYFPHIYQQHTKLVKLGFIKEIDDLEIENKNIVVPYEVNIKKIHNLFRKVHPEKRLEIHNLDQDGMKKLVKWCSGEAEVDGIRVSFHADFIENQFTFEPINTSFSNDIPLYKVYHLCNV